ncbi:hypothetical protein E4U17_003849 [Claviceps sp. LM77 group G4]|nr:hypothetical protein E4U17_003849 [Claviceps sp. LM77 group G4]KAG6070153.1 hypothetical protein E4U33_004355 [Claviceps sp. LM78 group G4]KAG6077402.1 hypothetical protein E4U16_002252 [Claviceps sp. LM84 group G4]
MEHVADLTPVHISDDSTRPGADPGIGIRSTVVLQPVVHPVSQTPGQILLMDPNVVKRWVWRPNARGPASP